MRRGDVEALLPEVIRLGHELDEPLQLNCPCIVVTTDDGYVPALDQLVAQIVSLVGRAPAVHQEPGESGDDVLADRLAQLCRVHGQFTLRSGADASTYFDKYMFEAEPSVLRAVAARMSELVPARTEILAGLELGGVPVATALSLATALPTVYVRKEAKRYGTAKLIEGPDIAGRRLLVVEDVISTGGQVVSSADQLRAHGAVVESVLCVIDRTGGNHSLLLAAGLEVIALFDAMELEGDGRRLER